MDYLHFSTRKGNCKMLQIMVGFLLFVCLIAGLCFFAGYMVGRVMEHVEVERLIERYYNK